MAIGIILLFLILIGVFYMSKEKITCPKINLMKYDFLGYNIWINENYKANFINAKLNILLLYPFHAFKIMRMDSYNCRYVRGYERQKIISYHGYGQATDINPSDFPSIRLKDNYGNIIAEKYTLPIWFIQIADCFKMAGFRWGGDWSSLFDPMHFEIGSRTV